MWKAFLMLISVGAVVEGTVHQWIPSAKNTVRTLIAQQFQNAVNGQPKSTSAPIYISQLRLQQQQARRPVPHRIYGPPSTPAPAPEYGAPPQQPDAGYGAPQQPQPEYGTPAQPAPEYGAPQQPGAGYGAPQQPETGYGAPQQPDTGYGAPQQPDTGYGAPQQPNTGYGAPQQPDTGYGAPQQPNTGYGAPQQPTPEYGAPQSPELTPEEGSGQAPLDLGASERLRQGHFIQQLPHFEPAHFRPVPPPMRSQPIRQNQQKSAKVSAPIRKPAPSRAPVRSQNIVIPTHQQLPINNFLFNFNSQRLVSKPTAAKQQVHQRIPAPLYTTPRAEELTTTTRTPVEETPSDVDDDVDVVPNVAVATAVSGRYFILQADGRLQRVSYTTLNGKLIDGDITSDLNIQDVEPITAPLYAINELNQLVRIN